MRQLNTLRTTDLMRVVNTKKRYLFINPSTHKIRLNNGAQRLKNQRAYIKVTDALRDRVRGILRYRYDTINHNYMRYTVTSNFSEFLTVHDINMHQYEMLEKILS